MHCMIAVVIHNYRALQLAMKYKTHVDTVLAFRAKYLSDSGCPENIKTFADLAGQVMRITTSIHA